MGPNHQDWTSTDKSKPENTEEKMDEVVEIVEEFDQEDCAPPVEDNFQMRVDKQKAAPKIEDKSTKPIEKPQKIAKNDYLDSLDEIPTIDADQNKSKEEEEDLASLDPIQKEKSAEKQNSEVKKHKEDQDADWDNFSDLNNTD